MHSVVCFAEKLEIGFAVELTVGFGFELDFELAVYSAVGLVEAVYLLEEVE